MNKKIICPHCGYEYTIEDMLACDENLFALAAWQDTAEQTCCSCERSFLVSGDYIPQYKTYKDYNDYAKNA